MGRRFHETLVPRRGRRFLNLKSEIINPKSLHPPFRKCRKDLELLVST